tara:strand:- start:349 stop:585 length:237 start_codon:yes stop_codon:yes gene_type:complete
MKTEAFFSGEYGNENDTVEMAVKFDSLLSAKLSDEHDLNVADFEDVLPSGICGFTVVDVRDIYERVRGETSVASASFR